MKVLVIGGNGFLGANLVYSFKNNFRVVAGVRKKIKKKSSSNYTDEVVIDWLNLLANKDNFFDVNTIIYAAGMNAFDCMAYPKKAFEINGNIPGKFVKIASEVGVKNFIYFSTAHVYNPDLSGDINEHSPTNNMHPYAQSHLLGERNILRESDSSEINTLIIRLSNGFGIPIIENKSCWNLVVNQLCRQAVDFGQMTINSNGTQRRNFIAMSEVSNATKHLLFGMKKNIKNEIYNVGSDWNPSIFELAETIQSRCQEILNFKPKINIKKSSADKSKAFFSIKKLSKSNYNCSFQVNEIDNLLRFCNSQI